MPNHRVPREDLLKVVELVRQHGSVNKAAQYSGMTYSAFNRRFMAARAQGLAEDLKSTKAGTSATLPHQPAAESFDVSGNQAEVTATVPERVQTLEQLTAVCKIDTAIWDVERFICNKWEMGSKDADDRPQVTALYQVKAWLRKRVVLIAARSEIDALKAEAKAALPARKWRTAKPTGMMLEPALPDLHVGKLAWADETGYEHYDIQTAERVFDDALHALIQRTKGYQFDRVVFPVGNDLLHADTKQGTTNAGTPLDTDSRYQKSFLVARRMLTRAITALRDLAPVHVVVVPGNHDTLGAWHLGDSLECFFHKHAGIVIDNAPTLRKYHQYGAVMLMFTHGNRGKLADYPLLMATEQPAMFGATRHREAHTGDKHQLKVQEFHGVRVRISPALCSPDAWHSEHHFVGNPRSAEAFVWHKDEGLVGIANYTVPAAKQGAA